MQEDVIRSPKVLLVNRCLRDQSNIRIITMLSSESKYLVHFQCGYFLRIFIYFAEVQEPSEHPLLAREQGIIFLVD